MMKRQRSRGRNPGQKPQSNNPNRAYESNGPDIKVRGSAQTVFEKYQQLSRDANSAGDRVLGENYQQHAEHYFRVLRAMQPTFVPRTEMMIAGYDDDADDGDDTGEMVEGGEGEVSEGADGASQPEFNPNRPPRDNRFDQNRDNRPDNRGEPRQDGDEDRFGRRRRRRRDRFGNEIPYNANGAGEESQGEGQRGPRMDQRSEPRPDSRPDSRADNRSGSRFEPRPDYRPEARIERAPENGQSPADEAYPRPARTAPNEFGEPSGFSQPQEIVTAPQDEPARERRPRPPRAPRAPREAKPDDQGFGADLPAFLSTPVPTPGGE